MSATCSEVCTQPAVAAHCTGDAEGHKYSGSAAMCVSLAKQAAPLLVTM